MVMSLSHEKAGLVEQGCYVPRSLVLVMVMVMSSEKSRRTCVSWGFSARESAIAQKKGIPQDVFTSSSMSNPGLFLFHAH